MLTDNDIRLLQARVAAGNVFWLDRDGLPVKVSCVKPKGLSGEPVAMLANRRAVLLPPDQDVGRFVTMAPVAFVDLIASQSSDVPAQLECPATPDELRALAEMLRDVPGGVGAAIDVLDNMASWLEKQGQAAAAATGEAHPSREALIQGAVRLVLQGLQEEASRDSQDSGVADLYCDPLYAECARLMDVLGTARETMTSNVRIVDQLVKAKQELQVGDDEWAEAIPIHLADISI